MKKKKLLAALCCCLLSGMITGQEICRIQAADTTYTEGAAGNTASGQEGEETSASEMLNGNTSDISFSGISVSGSKAGGTVKISFTVTGNKNNKKHYAVDKIERVYPVLDDSFPFVMTDEAYRVTEGNGSSVSCSYSFKAKDNLETAYYMAGFTVVYSRKATDGKTTAYDNEYSVNKSINVKLTAKPISTPKPEKEETSKDADISLKMNGTPYGVYGGGCAVAFTACSSKYNITSVVPVIDNNFPFESTSDAYKVIRSGGTRSLPCRYAFRVKKNVASGYQGVTFRITYVKNKQTVTADKTINVELKGKKQGEKDGKKSTPRVMVAGYTTNVKRIMPNSRFLLTLQIKNNASQTVRNIKFTLSTENGEFLPVSGASTAYLDSIAAKSTASISFEMKAGAGLGSKSYPITVKAEYEDGSAASYNSEDNVSIPVTLKDRISLTEIMPPDMLSVDGSGDLSFSINNKGAGSLNNVTVFCRGEDFTCEEAFVGNIAAGSTGYANVTLTGTQITGEDSDGECTIVVKYENAAGESRKYTEKTNVYVSEDMGDMGEQVEEMTGEEKTGLPLAAKAGIVIAALVIVVLVVRHVFKKRRLKKEEELMEDELL